VSRRRPHRGRVRTRLRLAEGSPATTASIVAGYDLLTRGTHRHLANYNSAPR
jgi:hypothetical protein